MKTSSGAAVGQFVYSSQRDSREIEYLGSAHSGAAVERLKAADMVITLPIMNGGQ
ncbi:MAG TPA: hypothetical protein VLW50_04210 [Streptosporangiaceae bacterium]|nr:hypothetical protein [Streptosporangiaceae bacterium]